MISLSLGHLFSLTIHSNCQKRWPSDKLIIFVSILGVDHIIISPHSNINPFSHCTCGCFCWLINLFTPKVFLFTYIYYIISVYKLLATANDYFRLQYIAMYRRVQLMSLNFAINGTNFHLNKRWTVPCVCIK